MTTIIMISNDSSVIINPTTNEDEEKCKVEKSKSEEKRRRDRVEKDDEDDDGDGDGEEEDDDDECNDVISPPFSSPDSPSSNNSIGSPPPSDTSSFISSKGGKNQGGRKSQTQKLLNNRRRYKTSLSTLESDSEDLNHSSSSSGTSTLNSGASLNLVHGAVPSIPSDLFLTSLDDNYISALKANAIIKPPRKSSSTPVVRTQSFSQPTQKAPSSQSSSCVKISSGPSGHKSLGSIKEVINSPSSGPHGLRFYINHPSCNSQVTALSRSDCSSNTITYDTKSLGRKHHCRPSEEKCSSLIAIGNRPLASAINTNGLPNVASYCTLIRSRTPKPKSRCHVQALPSVPDQNEDNPRSDEVSSCESNQSLFQQTGTRIKLSVSSGTSQKGHLESSQPSSLNNSCPRSEPEPASFSIYSDINDFKELFTSTNDGIGANVEKDIFKHHQLQKPLASIISNSVFWADSEDELIESQIEEPDIDNFTSDDDQLSEIAAARRLGNDCVGVLPTGCHRHPHHASLPPPRLRLDQDIDDVDDEAEFQTKGAETDGYLSSLLQDDWSKQTESDAIANRGFPGNAAGLFTSLGALWEDVEVQRQRNLRHRSKSSQRRLSPDMGRKLPGLKSGFNLAKSMDGLLLRDPSFAKPSSGSDVRVKGGGGITSNVKRFSSALSGLNLAANSKILRRHTTYAKGPKSGVSTIPTTTTTTSTASPIASNYHSERTHVSPWQSSTIERLQTHYQTPHVHSWHRNRITDRKGEELFANGKNEKLGWSSRGSSVRKHLVRRSLSSSKIDQLGQDSEETSWPPTSKTRVKGENKENDVVITDELDENSSQNGSLASDRGVDIGRVGMWATDFEKLLHDPVGLQTFTEFLKKEFSAENIFFWVACERYRHLENESERHTAAIQIMDRHLSAGAPDPVNVDSHARQAAQDGMATTTPTMFNLAQKQIYNLMKFDSFSRFLKSELYKESLLAEMSGNPLPFANDLEAPLTEKSGEESKGSSKEKSSLSWGKKSSKADVENRRRSLLPWGNLRGKDRSKSKERSIGESELRAAKSMTLVPSQGQHKLKAKSRDDLSQSSRASLTSADVSKLSNNSRDSSLSHNADCEGCTLARVILPDKATTVVQTRNQETIRAMVSRLLDKRGLKYTSFDVFAPNLDKPLDLSEDCSTLGCTEVRVEPRVLFRLELPSKKSIGVKAKPAKIVKDVLGPILSQYGWNLDEMRVKLDISRIDIDLEDTVQSIDNSRLVVTGRMPTEEVNSRLFEDMMRSKRPHNNGLDDQRSVRTDSSTESSTRIYKKVPGGDTEKQSMPPPERIPMKRGGGGSAFAKPKNANGPPSSAAILKNTGVTEELYEGLKLAQRGRLDDQRGTEINFEMPDFLKRGDANPRPNQGKENSHPFQSPLSHRQSEPTISNHRLDVFPPDPRLSTISSNNFYSQIENDYHTLNHPNHPSPFGRPPRDSFYVHNRSNDSNFSQEGYLPNSSEADRFFNLSNHSGEFSSGQFNESRVSLGFGNTPYRRGASTQPHHSLPPQSLEPPQNLYETLSHYKSGWNTPGTSLPPMADPTMLMRREPPPLPPKPKFGRMGRPNGVSSEIDMPMHQAPQHQQHQQQQQQQQQPRGYSVSFV